MPSDDELRMTATLINKVTPELKNIQRDMAKFGTETQRQMPRAFMDFEKQVKRTQDALGKLSPVHRRNTTEFEALRKQIGRVVPAFGELDSAVTDLSTGTGTMVATMAAGGVALAEIGKKAAEAARQMRDLKFGSRETGLAPQRLHEMQIGLQRFGVSADETTASLETFSNNLVKLRRNADDFYGRLRAMGETTFANNMMAKLQANANDTAGAFQTMVDEFDRLKAANQGPQGEQMARSLARIMGVSENFARITGPALAEMFQQMRQFGIAPSDFDALLRSSQKLNTQLNIADIVLDKWKLRLEGAIIPDFLKLIGPVETLVGDFATMYGWVSKTFDLVPKVGGAIHGGLVDLGRATAPQHPTALNRFDDKLGQMWRDFLGQRPTGQQLNVPHYQSGTAFVPRDQLASLHRGEIVLPPQFSSVLRSLAGGSDLFRIFGMLERLLGGLFGGGLFGGGGGGGLGGVLGSFFGGGAGGVAGGGFGRMLGPLGSIASRLFHGGLMSHEFHGGPAPGGVIMPHGGLARLPHVRGQGVVPRHALTGPSIAMPEPTSGEVDRSMFANVASNPALVRRLASMVQGEVGLRSNVRTQRAILEEAFNRWYVRGEGAGADLYHGRGGYYAAATFRPVSDAQVEAFRKNVLGPVLGGSNVIRGMTGNASNEPGNMVAMHQFARGTKGFWMDLKTGQPVALPSSYMGGKAEAMFMEGPFRRRLPLLHPNANVADAAALREHYTAAGIWSALGGDADRHAVNGALGASMRHHVEGTGAIDVRVRAPAGTRVSGKASGLFKTLRIQRNAQMPATIHGAPDVPSERDSIPD